MIRSMTGYGSAKGEAAGLALSVELKSVNNRYLDVSVKLPRALMFSEEPVKAAISAASRSTSSSPPTPPPPTAWRCA